jgi:hypothetical protein
MYELLAAAVDAVHGLAMLLWGLGLPLLFYPRHQWIKRAYVQQHDGRARCGFRRRIRSSATVANPMRT